MDAVWLVEILLGSIWDLFGIFLGSFWDGPEESGRAARTQLRKEFERIQIDDIQHKISEESAGIRKNLLRLFFFFRIRKNPDEFSVSNFFPSSNPSNTTQFSIESRNDPAESGRIRQNR